MILPKPVYETLPAIYVGSGIYAITMVDSLMSFISGIILGVSGVAVLWLRRNYRRTLDKRPKQIAA